MCSSPKAKGPNPMMPEEHSVFYPFHRLKSKGGRGQKIYILKLPTFQPKERKGIYYLIMYISLQYFNIFYYAKSSLNRIYSGLKMQLWQLLQTIQETLVKEIFTKNIHIIKIQFFLSKGSLYTKNVEKWILNIRMFNTHESLRLI